MMVLDWLHETCRNAAETGWLPASFQYAFVVNSLLCALMIGPLLGGIGTMVVIKRLAFFSEAVGHAALTGVAIGIIVGEPYTSPYISLFGFCILYGLVIRYTINRTHLSSDTLIGVYLSITLAVGACMLIFVSSKINTHLIDQILFGSILTAGATDMKVLCGIALICIFVGLLLYNRMLLVSFNVSLARVRGVKVSFLHYLFIFMVTIVTVASVKIIGSMLVLGLLVIPAATSRNLVRSIRGFFFGSMLIATVTSVFGIMLSMELPIPSGGAIIIVGGIVFFLSVIVRVVATRRREAA
jgi:zinc transport system permease protein